MLINKLDDLSYDIIFPFYKDYKYLKKAIISVNNQSLIPKNLVFIDDGNKDPNLKNLIKNLLSKKINLKFIKQENNYGNIYGVNEGLKHVETEFFFIMAADDIYYDDLALISLKSLKKYKNAGFVFSNVISNFEDLNKKITIKYSFLKKEFYNSDDSKKILKYKKIKFYHNTVFYRSDFFKQSNYFKDIIGPRCDFYNLIFFSAEYGFVYVNQQLAEFSIRSGQINRQYDDNYLLQEIEKIKLNFKSRYDISKSLDMFFDLSPLGLLKLNKLDPEIISVNLIKKSIFFFIWKKLRKYTPNFVTQIVYKIIN